MKTVIHSEIDFDIDGKHTGYLRLPHSVHRSAYGWIPIPIASIKHILLEASIIQHHLIAHTALGTT